MASKQSKIEQPVESTPLLLPSVGADQAPVVPAEFTPYSANAEYEPPFSSTLLAKSNELARGIFKDQQGYNSFTQPYYKYPLDVQAESSVEANNLKYFNGLLVDQAVHRIATIRVGLLQEQWAVGVKILETIKKVHRLEKLYDAYEILDDDARERIINTTLMPASQFGVQDFHAISPGLRFPMQKSVVTEILSEDDIATIDSIVSWLPLVRQTLANHKSWTPGMTKAQLLTPALPPKSENAAYAFHTPEADAQLINKIKQLRHFFQYVIPHNTTVDLISPQRAPLLNPVHEAFTKMTNASAKLRDVSAGFIREEKPLSELLQAIYDLSLAMRTWLSAECNEVNRYFNYLSRIGMTFDQLVEESAERIRESDVPW